MNTAWSSRRAGSQEKTDCAPTAHKTGPPNFKTSGAHTSHRTDNKTTICDHSSHIHHLLCVREREGEGESARASKTSPTGNKTNWHLPSHTTQPPQSLTVILSLTPLPLSLPHFLSPSFLPLLYLLQNTEKSCVRQNTTLCVKK